MFKQCRCQMDKIILTKPVFKVLDIVNDLDMEFNFYTSVNNYSNLSIENLIIQSPKKIGFYKNFDLMEFKIFYQSVQSCWYLRITFNPNKIHQSLNEIDFPVDYINKEDYKDVLVYVDTFITNMTKHIDIYYMKVREYHIAIDVITEYLYSKYNYIYNNLNKPNSKMAKKGFKDSEYIINSNRSIVIYDKAKEFWKKGEAEKNITRLEYRKKIKNEKPLLININYNKLLIDAVGVLKSCFEYDTQENSFDLIKEYLNDPSLTVNKALTKIKSEIFYMYISDYMNKNGIDSISDLIHKDLSISEKERLSKFNKENKTKKYLGKGDIDLHKEILEKIKEIEKSIKMSANDSSKNNTGTKGVINDIFQF